MTKPLPATASGGPGATENFAVEPTQMESPYGIAGTAFYDEVPIEAVWYTYQETLTLYDYGSELSYPAPQGDSWAKVPPHA